MPSYSLSEAARLANVDQSTLYRQVQSGILSVQVNAKNRKTIELSELLRVYPEVAGKLNPKPGLQDQDLPSPALQEVSKLLQNEVLQVQVEALQSQVELLQRLVESKDEELQRAQGREQWLQDRIVNSEVKLLTSSSSSGGVRAWIEKLLGR